MLKKTQAYLSKIERGEPGVDVVKLGEFAKVYSKDINNMQRGFIQIPILLTILLGLIVLGGGTYFVVQQKSASQTTSQTVQKINWSIEKANPNITDDSDYRKSEQAISVDATFSDNTTKRYNLGTAYGCTGSTVQSAENGKIVLGKINCYFSLTGVGFVAYTQNGKFVVERNDESAKDGSIKTTVLLQI